MTSQDFKVKLNLIRNRSFLSNDMSRQGTAEKVLFDLYRSMELISINGETLKEIFITAFKIETRNKTSQEVDEEILTFLPSQDNANKEPFERILTLYKDIFFQHIPNEETRHRLAQQLSTITYQKGMFFILGNRVSEDLTVANQGYYPQTETTISINTTDDGFFVDETCHVTAIMDANLPPIDEDKPLFEHSNPDNSPMMTLKNRFHLCVDEDVLKYAHTDLTIEYNSDLCKTLFDERGFFEKIKDFFKSIFFMNDIEELPIDRPASRI